MIICTCRWGRRQHSRCCRGSARGNRTRCSRRRSDFAWRILHFQRFCVGAIEYTGGFCKSSALLAVNFEAEADVIGTRPVKYRAVRNLSGIEPHVAMHRPVVNVQNAALRGANEGVVTIPAKKNAIALTFDSQAETRVGKDGAEKRWHLCARAVKSESGGARYKGKQENGGDPRYAAFRGLDNGRKGGRVACVNFLKGSVAGVGKFAISRPPGRGWLGERRDRRTGALRGRSIRQHALRENSIRNGSIESGGFGGSGCGSTR